MARKFLSLLVPVAIAFTVLNAATAGAQTPKPEVAASHVNRGKTWFPGDDLQRALRDYDVAIIFHPNSASAYYNRAVLLQEAGELDKALADYTKAIELKPRYSSAYSSRAAVYYAEGRIDEAL